MQPSRLVIVGGGFAGLWAAAAAAAAAHATGPHAPLAISLVTPHPALSIRPRLYEADLEPSLVELAPLLEPLGVRVHLASATHIDVGHRVVHADDASTLPFDAAVVGIGSWTPLPPLPGLAEHAHRIDVHARADDFRTALTATRSRTSTVRVTVVGGGLTGIELATELGSEPDLDVTLIDSSTVGDTFGPDATAIIRGALAELGVKVVDDAHVVAATHASVALRDGGTVAHDLLVWAGGLRAHDLDGLSRYERDELGRLVVDHHLQVPGTTSMWAAGDSARCLVDGDHVAPMSCQFAIPTGQVAGHNAAAALLGLEPRPLAIDRYVTCVDLGRTGALLTRGWDRAVALTGHEGKKMKTFINRTAIYPPSTPEALLDAAAHPGTDPTW